MLAGSSLQLLLQQELLYKLIFASFPPFGVNARFTLSQIDFNRFQK